MGDSSIVTNISINDTISNVFYKDLNFLKNINYRPLIGEKQKITVIIPVAFIVASVNKPKTRIPMIEAGTIMNKLMNMFAYESEKSEISTYVYLNPLISLCSTIIYN